MQKEQNHCHENERVQDKSRRDFWFANFVTKIESILRRKVIFLISSTRPIGISDKKEEKQILLKFRISYTLNTKRQHNVTLSNDVI